MREPCGLDADLTVERPGFRLDLQLLAGNGEVVALLGPNGAGKTTALRALAGLQPLDAGHLRLDDMLLEDAATGLRVPTRDRRIGLVFQDYLLFPHLSALDNVAFGPRARGMRKAEARAQARAWLERVGLADQLSARPGALSGGQGQRVALARALAGSPRLLLLDEPLSALDASTRLEVRSDLRHHLESYDGVTVLVSHDALDAMVLSDRVLVVEDGRITQQGRPEEIARAPRTEYVARLVGLNLYRGTADGDVVRLDGGGVLRLARALHGSVHVAFPPSAVSLFPSEPHGSPRNRWPVTVRAVEQHGAIIRVGLDGTPPVLADVTAGAVAELGLAPGVGLWAALKASETRAYPA